MINISTEDLEQKIAAGEEVIDRYFDPITRLGTPRPMTSRRSQEIAMTSLALPHPMLDELNKMAHDLNISDQHSRCDPVHTSECGVLGVEGPPLV
jgi:hypothetical protein